MFKGLISTVPSGMGTWNFIVIEVRETKGTKSIVL